MSIKNDKGFNKYMRRIYLREVIDKKVKNNVNQESKMVGI
jgi:hypothetical protein